MPEVMGKLLPGWVSSSFWYVSVGCISCKDSSGVVLKFLFVHWSTQPLGHHIKLTFLA